MLIHLPPEKAYTCRDYFKTTGILSGEATLLFSFLLTSTNVEEELLHYPWHQYWWWHWCYQNVKSLMVKLLCAEQGAVR